MSASSSKPPKPWVLRTDQERKQKNTPPHAKANPLAAISQKNIDLIFARAHELTASFPGYKDEASQEILKMILDTNSKAELISSCDLPSDLYSLSPGVLAVQKKQDVILGTHHIAEKDHKKILHDFAKQNFDLGAASLLEKIDKISEITFVEGFGNCGQKAFFAFINLLKQRTATGMIFNIELSYFDNHYIVIVNNQFVVDPWLNLAFPFQDRKDLQKVYQGQGELVKFFEINKKSCLSFPPLITDTEKENAASTDYLTNLMTSTKNSHLSKALEKFAAPEKELKDNPTVMNTHDDSKTQGKEQKRPRSIFEFERKRSALEEALDKLKKPESHTGSPTKKRKT